MSPDPAGRTPFCVVLDTTVWISAALTRAGAFALLVRRVLSHGLPVFSLATFAELESRLWLPKFDRYLSMELRRRILHDLGAASMWVDVPEDMAQRTFCRDPGDDPFIHAALTAQARWLVTGDRDLLELSPLPDLAIISPAEALHRSEAPWS